MSGQAAVTGRIAGSGGPIGLTVDGRSMPWREGNPVPGSSGATFPVFRFGWAPVGLATRRQLSACGLRPGGAQPVAQLQWRAGRRWADLYALDTAKPKRPMTPGKAAALAAAMRARRICPACRRDAGYCIPRSLGRCLDCHDHHHGQDGGPSGDVPGDVPATGPWPQQVERAA